MKSDPAESVSLKTEIIISELLRWGVFGSLLLLAGGTILCFVHSTDYGAAGGNAADLHRLITDGNAFPRTLSWLGHALLRGEGQAVIVAGLLLLIATPVIRVMISIVAFAIEKDRRYVVITSVVFLLLLVSFLLGKAG
jgi:uncharacterized membrane protein